MKPFYQLFLALIVVAASACTASKKTASPGAKSGLGPSGIEDGLLWEVSGNGLTKPSYLFGTMHVINSTFIDSFPVIRQRVNAADAVVGEVVIDSAEMFQVAMYMISLDTTLDKLLTPREFKYSVRMFEEATGQSGAAVRMMKPAAVEALIADVAFKDKYPGLTEGTPMDVYFQQIAKKQGKPILGFETLTDQAKLLFSQPLKEQAKSLKKTIADSAKMDTETSKMVNCYRNGDNDCLYGMMDESSLSDKMNDALLKDRNDNWIRQLPDMMRKQSVFVAVGAMHLSGPSGLVQQLRRLGYTVKPVEMKK